MNNDYERYDFWHRETVQVKKSERTMEKLIESNKKFNKKDSKYYPNDRSEDNFNITNFFI